MKQVVYIDILIGVNLIINYFLILATSRFLYLKLKRLRLILGEILGGLYSLYIFLPDNSVFVSVFIKLFMASSIVGVVFGFKNFKIFIKSLVYFYISSFSFSGIMFFLWYTFKPSGMVVNNGVVYFNISPLILIGSTLIAYTILEIVHRILEKRENKNLICDVFIKVGERSLTFKAKVDTCSSLKEPFSDLPVIVVSESILKEFLPKAFENFSLKSLSFSNLENIKNDFKLRLIPFKTVSGEGLLPSFKPEFLKINNSEKEAYIALCGENILPYNVPALINPLLID